MRQAGTRLMFIVDNDFGELTWAMLFTHDRPLALRTTLMLPPRLFDLNKGVLPARALRYSSYGELKKAIEAEQPDIVFLFSGYLLPVHGFISEAQFEELVGGLLERNVSVVTSDPFWGLMTAPLPLISPQVKALTRSVATLRRLPHLHVAPHRVEGLESVTFFNPSFVDAKFPLLPDDFWRDAGVREASQTSRYWLFALTREDCNLQISLFSKEGFAGRVVTMLANTLLAGRYPVLLAPEDFIPEVASRLENASAAALLAYCDYSLFMSLLVHAEYVFFWNAGSTSAHVRMVRGQPFFCFDPGHVARHVGDWLQLTVSRYYRGWIPPYLDHDTELKEDALARLETEYRQAADVIRTNLARAPTPEGMIDQLQEGRAGGLRTGLEQPAQSPPG